MSLVKNFLSPHPLSAFESVLSLTRIITGLFMVYHGWEVFDASKMQEYALWDMFKIQMDSPWFI